MRHPLLRCALAALIAGCSNMSGSTPPGPAHGEDDAGSASSLESGAPAVDSGDSRPTVDASSDAATSTTGPADAGSGADRTVVDASGSPPQGDSADAGGPPSDAGAGAQDSGSGTGTGATDASAGDGGFTLPITNAGCKNANPPTGSLNLPIGGNQANYVVTLPNGYRANTPVPLVFGFHGRNRTNTDFENVDALDIKTEMAPFAIMVYPKSQGGPGWEQTGELPLNIQFFEAMWTQMFSNYCVDPARVFVIGHSSGAMFSNILACRYGDRLRGVGAVAGEQLETTCVGNVAAMIIHGGQDPIVANSLGRASRDFYLQRNGCQMTTTPGEVAPCVAYDGCESGLPVEWCEHTEPTYTMTDGGGHGYPSFASKAMWHFFSPLMAKTP